MEFISYSEALAIVERHPFRAIQSTKELEDCLGAILSEDLIADRPFPPFNRVTMDGIAIDYKSFESGQISYEIEKTVPAGMAQYSLTDKTCCVQIMTGAIMPIGVDTVIRYEDITISGNRAHINVKEIKPQQNVHFKGIDKQEGDVIVKRGIKLGAPEMNIAAAIGHSQLEVLSPPKAIIITTGDELVPINETPKTHQIRRSGNYGVQAILNQLGIDTDMHHLKDDKAMIKNDLKSIIETYSCIVLMGGVSKGKFDYLPEVLEELGVKKHFHKVNQRPGKPFWFGTAANGTTIFALPGNPVSSFMCASVYIKAWVNASLKQKALVTKVKLGEEISFTPPLTYFLECSTQFNDKAELVATPFIGHGSGDFANLAEADGFVILPENQSTFKKGDVFDFVSYRTQF